MLSVYASQTLWASSLDMFSRSIELVFPPPDTIISVWFGATEDAKTFINGPLFLRRYGCRQ